MLTLNDFYNILVVIRQRPIYPTVTQQAQYFNKICNDGFQQNINIFREHGDSILYNKNEFIVYTHFNAGYIFFNEIIPYNAYAISYDFNGCAMAKVKFTNNRTYVFHIYLDRATADCRKYWNSFIAFCYKRNIIQNIIMFYPYRHWINNNNPQYKAMGIIDASNECSTILYNQSNQMVSVHYICLPQEVCIGQCSKINF